MKLFAKFLTIFVSFAFFVVKTESGLREKIKYTNGQKPYNPGACNSLTKGDLRMVKDRNDRNRFLVCIEQTTNEGTLFHWKMISNSVNSYGNYFEPADDCSSVLDTIPEAESGIYWIKTKNGPRKAWCDLRTDGGGFMLIGVQNSSRTMDVPSDDKLVHPLDLRHWSSSFGGKNILDFRVQIATSKTWSDTKAHWYYRFNSPRKLSNLLLHKFGDCDEHHPGVGDIKFVKDLQDDVVATKQFQCSRFDSYFHTSLGWGKMNQCFQSPCEIGFNHLNLATSGAFSFSIKSSTSGIINNSTKFIGCERDKCCVCYGPSSDKDYCAPGCKSINGGTVLIDDVNSEIHAWYWIRTSLPQRVWKKCMEYEKTDGAGKAVKWHVDKNTGVPKQGPCSYPGDVKLNGGIAVVENEESLKKLPKVEGLLSYRADNRELYLREKHHWNAMAKENEVQQLQTKVETSQKKFEGNFKTSQRNLEKKFEASQNKLENEINRLSEKLLKLEEESTIYSSCKKAYEKISGAKTGMYKIATVSGYTYCHMTSLPGCSGGGWTLVMKVNGKKESFNYDSSYWSNQATYNPAGGQTGFDEQETKLPTYWNTPFEEICLGMKVGNNLKFISISYQASSLYNVIAHGNYRATNIGRSKWLSMVSGSDLQPYCSREGFNVVGLYQSARIGILGNQENNCNSPDSYFGFGGFSKNKRISCYMPKISNTCGNAAYCMLWGRPNKEIPAMGYILVR